MVELAMADLQIVQSALERARAKLKAGLSLETDIQIKVLEKLEIALRNGQPARSVSLTKVEEVYRRELSLLTAKPMLLVYNSDEKITSFNDGITLCAKIEAELADLNEAERQEYMRELGIQRSGLDQLITAAYQALDLITFLTTGPKETRAWTVTRGATAPQAAGKIHSDFEAAFIRAEVISYQDFIACGGEAGARQTGKLRIEGKDYVIQDGDVCHFRVGV